MYYVYVLYDKAKNKFYIGSTNNLSRRTQEHNLGKSKTTKGMKSKNLVYYEASISKKDTLKRELQLKTGFGRGYLRRRVRNYLEK